MTMQWASSRTFYSRTKKTSNKIKNLPKTQKYFDKCTNRCECKGCVMSSVTVTLLYGYAPPPLWTRYFVNHVDTCQVHVTLIMPLNQVNR